MIGIVLEELIIAFTIGCSPLFSSFITHNLEFKIPTPESSEHMIELNSWSFFFSWGFYIACILVFRAIYTFV